MTDASVAFPIWGDQADLVRLIDVQPTWAGHFVGPAYPTTGRNVVEGGQMIAQAIVAASKTVPDQRVTSAHMIFSKAAMFDAPLDLDVDVMRSGRTFSTIAVRTQQHEQLRSSGLLLMSSAEPDVIRGSVEMPDVAGPDESPVLDMGVTGREMRDVDGAYMANAEEVGPPEIHVWTRFRDAPREQHMHAALVAQSTTHWTIAAAMRPHPGIGESAAHVSLSTGIMTATLAFHDEVDVSEWLLYSNTATYAGRGLAQGDGRVFTRHGRLVASYAVQAMIRSFDQDASNKGLDHTNAM